MKTIKVLRGCPHLFSASNGREALDKYEEEGGKFDLVVMDCLMPVLDGYKAARFDLNLYHKALYFYFLSFFLL